MIKVNLRGCAALAVGVCLALPAAAAEPKIPKSVLVEAARVAPSGRGVEVVVGQAELGSNINPSMLSVALAGGILPVLLDAKIASDRAQRAEGGITPVRTALIDFDADQLAVDTTETATKALPWFAGKAADFARDPTTVAKSARLDAANEGQVAFFDYVYDTTPDFSAIRVGVRIILANKAGAAAGEKRLSPKNLAFDQSLTSVILLAGPGAGPDNAARWAAHDGLLAKRALTAAFSEVGLLIPRAMTLNADELQAMQGREAKTVGAYRGKLQDEGPGGTLLFNGGLVHVQTLRE